MKNSLSGMLSSIEKRLIECNSTSCFSVFFNVLYQYSISMIRYHKPSFKFGEPVLSKVLPLINNIINDIW